MQVEQWLETQLGRDIWKGKYCNENETLDQFFDRVSSGNKSARELVKEKKFLFGGRILASRGLQNKGRKISFSNCYVVNPPADSIESIFDCAKNLARTYSYGGGCGVDISNLSPKGAKIRNAAKETTGSISFMDLYSLVTELIGQQGRRGALMLSMDCTHPDIEEFITLKSDLTKVNKANISVRISDDFMNAVKNNTDWELKFTRPETGETISKTVKAKELFNLMAKMNWDYGEPGMLNWDRIKSWNLLSEDKNFEFAGVNPCAEEPLPAGGSCLLGSINLSEFVTEPFTKNATFDMEEFKSAVVTSVIALNEVLHEGLPLHPLEEQRESVNKWRQIGVGILGWHDALIKLGIRYGSPESIELADKVGFEMANTAILQSAYLTYTYGTYPGYNKEAVLSSPYFLANTTESTRRCVKEVGLANSQLLTIAPTGSIGTMINVSTGIEPIYNIAYTRKTESLHDKDTYYKVYTPIVEQYMKINNITNEEDLPDFINTAMTLDYKERLKMQEAWQRHIDASISSTVNVPNSFTVEDVENLYMMAWEKGLKGVTIFRDGCARLGILTNEPKKEKKETQNTLTAISIPRGIVEEVPSDLTYRKYKLKTGCGKLYFFVGIDEVEGRIYDVFTNTNAVGGCVVNTQANSRLLSAGIRGGIPIEYLIEQLDKSGTCASYQSVRGHQNGMNAVKKIVAQSVSEEMIEKINMMIGEPISPGKSCSSSIGIILRNILKEFEDDEADMIPYEKVTKEDVTKIKTQECTHSNLKHESGCVICPDCGWSKCD